MSSTHSQVPSTCQASRGSAPKRQQCMCFDLLNLCKVYHVHLRKTHMSLRFCSLAVATCGGMIRPASVSTSSAAEAPNQTWGLHSKLLKPCQLYIANPILYLPRNPGVPHAHTLTLEMWRWPGFLLGGRELRPERVHTCSIVTSSLNPQGYGFRT